MHKSATHALTLTRSQIKALVSARAAVGQFQMLSGMPSGCRVAMLATLEAQSEYRPSAWLAPRLSASGLGFADIHLDHTTGGLRATRVPVSRSFGLIHAADVPVPQRSQKFTITHRHVRVVSERVSVWEEGEMGLLMQCVRVPRLSRRCLTRTSLLATFSL
jgi:hypothetical protein